MRDAYAHLADKRRAELEKTLRRHGIDSIELQTDSDYIPALRRFFRTRERRLARLVSVKLRSRSDDADFGEPWPRLC